MDVRLLAHLEEPKSDTVVDPSPRRRRRRRPIAPTRGQPEAPPEAEPEGALGVRGDPGATLARSALTRVRVREAIVRRNHQIDAARARAKRRSSSLEAITLVRIDWVRARDTGLRVERRGPDTIVVSGRASGRAPACPVVSGRSPSSVRRVPALSIGIDGLLFTEPVEAGDSARECVARWCHKLEARYEIDVQTDGDEERDAVVLRFVRPRALC